MGTHSFLLEGSSLVITFGSYNGLLPKMLQHWSRNVIILTKFPSLNAPEVVKWQLPVHPVTKSLAKWWNFCFREAMMILFTRLNNIFFVYIPSKFKCLHPRKHALTHWGWVAHICVGKLTIISSDNGLSPGRHQAIILINAAILSTRP